MSVNRTIDAEQLHESIADFWPVKPEPGSVADQLIKKGENIGEARAEARGEARGKIRLLQQILRIPEITDAEFATLDSAALESILAELQSQLRTRL
ncbi:MAG: hypothetical protein ABL921_16540 [Pirellula sp.]